MLTHNVESDNAVRFVNLHNKGKTLTATIRINRLSKGQIFHFENVISELSNKWYLIIMIVNGCGKVWKVKSTKGFAVRTVKTLVLK